ncbi:MAG: hypothetical protein KAT58_12655 [candidate division Zixibacteria bacterium]|nr:hypothetical protein [candidate division Zixibacteria bacterium]
MKPSRVRWGIFWILIGLVFLANNAGWLSWWVWADLAQLWPVLLIAIGLEMIVRKSKIEWLGYLSTLIIIGAFVWAISENGGVRSYRIGLFDDDTLSEVSTAYDNQTSANIEVQFADGRLYFRSDDKYLFQAKSRNSRDELTYRTECDDSHCYIELTPHKRHWRRFIHVGSDDNHWKCYIHPRVDASYHLDLDEADLRFYAEGLRLDTLRIEAKRSDLLIRFDDANRHILLDLDGRRTTVACFIPDSVGLKIEGDSLTPASIDRFNLTRAGEFYINDLYGEAAANILIKSDIRNGRLKLRRY